MNFRTTAILFGIVLVFGLILLSLNLFMEEGTSSDALVEELASAGVKSEQVDTVEIERANAPTVLKFVKTGKDSWAVDEPVKARADAAAVDSIVNALFRVRPTAYAELSSNLAAHGLAPPSLKVTLRAGERASTVNIGDVTFGSKAVAFVTTSARQTRPMAVPVSDISSLFRDNATRAGGPAGDLAKWTPDYRAKQVFAVDTRTGGEDVAAFKLSSKGKDLALSRAGGDWKFDAPAGWGEAAVGGDTSAASVDAITGVRPLLNALVNLQAQAADDFIEAPKDLKEYGLDPGNPDLIRVEIKPKDGPPEVAYIGKKADAAPPTPPLPGSPPPAGKVYVRVEGSAGVIRASAGGNLGGLAAIIADPAPLRDRDLLREDVRNRVDAIDVTAQGQTVKLRKPAGSTEWKLYGGPEDPKAANQAAVTALLSLLTQPRIIKDFPASNDANFAGPELKAEVKLWADGIEANADPKADPKAEPKLKGTPTVLQFGKKDAAGIFVRRTASTGAKADFILPERVKVGTAPQETDVLAAVAKTRLDYFEAPVKSFSAFQATRLTIQNEKKVTEVAFDKSASPNFPAGRWTFAQPAELKGVVADAELIRADLLNFLASQKADRFVAEHAGDDQLTKWHLHQSNVRLKVVVGLEGTGADKERVYWFGDTTPDGKEVYTRQDDGRVVFTVPKSLADKFANADLRDKAVVHFDPSKVKKLRIRGWREKTGEMLIREFGRQNGTWAAVTPPSYPVDPAKVDEFLREIQKLRVKTYLPPGRRPEHQFPPEQSGFEVTIEMDGAPTILLNIAATVENGASRVGALGSPPSEALFTVPADALKAYRENPGAFAK